MPLFRALAKNMAPMTNADESPTNRLTSTLWQKRASGNKPVDILQQTCYQQATIKPVCHMSPMIGESLSVIIQGENFQRILLMSNHRQWLSPMSATYENQASGCVRMACDSLRQVWVVNVIFV